MDEACPIYPPIADLLRADINVCFVPLAGIAIPVGTMAYCAFVIGGCFQVPSSASSFGQ